MPRFFVFTVPLLIAFCGNKSSSEEKPNPKSDNALPSVITLDVEEQSLLSLINAYRIENKKQTLAVDDALSNAASWLSQDMADKGYFSHTDSLNRNPFKRMSDFLYNLNTTKSENIAAGNNDATATFTQWKNSPGHNTNMLGRFTVIGIGRAYNAASTYKWYWTTDFGGKTRTK